MVTGASRGIGRATAIRFAHDFGSIALVSRGAAQLADTAKAVQTSGAETLLLAMDLREPSAASAVVDQTVARFGGIDAVINIAGAVPHVDLFSMTDAEWDDGLALKFHGARRVTLAAWSTLRARGGSVVFTSGTSAEAPKASFAAVGAINAAIAALAKAFSESGVKEGVQVNSVLPGSVMTSRRRTMLEAYARNHNLTPEEGELRFVAESGIQRFGQPEDVAALIALLVSPAASWITGTAVRVDGGETRAIF